MFDHIPMEVHGEIIKRLPLESLIQLRSVSKAWKYLIDSAEFIAAHSVWHTHPHRLLVGYGNLVEANQKTYEYIVDNHTFPENFDLTVPLCVRRLKDSKVVGSSHGLFCLTGYYEDSGESLNTKKMVVVWNPSIRKSITISVSNPKYESVIGFGVCPVTNNPKILFAGFGKVKVFTLNSRDLSLRSTTINLPFDLASLNGSQSMASLNGSQAIVDGFIYWLVSDKISKDGGVWIHNLIMSFDLANNEFRKVNLPDCLGLALFNPDIKLSIYKLRNSLGVVKFRMYNADNQWCEVWMMNHGVPNSCIKLFTFKVPKAYFVQVLGFRTSGEPILEVAFDSDRYYENTRLAVYNHYSDYLNGTHIIGCDRTFFAYSYTPTLLLLNQKDSGCYLDFDEDENDD